MTRLYIIAILIAAPFTVAFSEVGFNIKDALVGSGPSVTAKEDGDPGQGLYKSGYNGILDERWSEARKTFADLLKRFPQSTYADDARYWSAYALMHMDRQKALKEYREFVNRHPKSTYLSDAIADMGNIEAEIETERVRSYVEHMARSSGRNDSSLGESRKAEQDRADQMNMLRDKLEAIRHSGRGHDSMFFQFPGMPVTPEPPIPLDPVRINMRGFAMGMKRFGWRMQQWGNMQSSQKFDKGTQLRLEALEAIGHGDEDDRGFQTLKGVALDRSQPVVLRIEAMDQLSEFTKHDAAPVFLEVARTDTSEEMQSASLDRLHEVIKDKSKSVETLGSLYNGVPQSHENQRSMILYEIADIGNDPAVDFLSDVARRDSSYDLRSEAVYYLGNIGGEKARAVLYDVLMNK